MTVKVSVYTLHLVGVSLNQLNANKSVVKYGLVSI